MRVIDEYKQAAAELDITNAELTALTKHHKKVLKEIANLQNQIANSDALLTELRSKTLRGLANGSALAKAKKARDGLLVALKEQNEMNETAKKIALPLQQRAHKQMTTVDRLRKGAWAAVAGKVSVDLPPLPEPLLAAYAAARNSHLPPSSFGDWMDSRIGAIDEKSYASKVATRFGL